jgi:molecular chaperone GrpE
MGLLSIKYKAMSKSNPPVEETRQPDASGGGDPDPMAILDTDLKKLQEERNILFEQLARVQADFRNAQKRLEMEKSQAIQFANTRIISSLLPVLDNFERALGADAQKTDAATILKGLRIVYDQLIATFRQNHIEEIAPEPGTPFDPNLHQALLQQPDDRYPEPVITQLLQKGYSMHGRTLRPAQVAVSKTT